MLAFAPMAGSQPKSKKSLKPSHLTPVSDVLQSLLQNSKSALGEEFKRWRLWYQWGDVVGPQVAACTEPVGYVRGTLWIWVQSSTRLQELSFVAPAMKQKINTHLGKNWVKHVRFTLDRKAVPKVSESAQDWQGLFSKPPPNEDDLPPRDR